MLVLQAGLTNFRTLADKSGRVQFDTPELTPDMFSEIGKVNGKQGVLVFSPGVEKIPDEQMEAIKNFDVNSTVEKITSKKSKSQRVRAMLYRLYEKNNEGFDTFDDFYSHFMDTLITHLRKKLDNHE